MKQQEVFKKIGVIIKELNDQYEYLKTVDGPLNELELELFLANSHFLGDHVVILSKLNAQNIAPKKVEEKPVEHHSINFFEPLVQAPVNFNKPTEKLKPVIEDIPSPEINPGGSGEDTYAFIPEQEPQTIRHELILDEADWEDEDEEQKDISDEEIEIPPVPEVKAREKEITREPEVIAEEKETEILPVEEVKPVEGEIEIPTVVEVKANEPEPVVEPPVAEKAKPAEKEEVLTINERLSAKMAESRNATDQTHIDKIADLKKAITLNEKLLYIKDLFNGYSLAYSEAIEILNRFTSLNEADLFLKKNYVVKNKWEGKPETTAKFYALLQRRYA